MRESRPAVRIVEHLRAERGAAPVSKTSRPTVAATPTNACLNGRNALPLGQKPTFNALEH
jgi:hypothetical protein